jgi:hypothetical protein
MDTLESLRAERDAMEALAEERIERLAGKLSRIERIAAEFTEEQKAWLQRPVGNRIAASNALLQKIRNVIWATP